MNHDIEPFRELALDLHSRGVTWSEMAYRAGYIRKDKYASVKLFKTKVGLAPEKRGKLLNTITDPTAMRMLKALNCDPHEVGI
jgi:hypothetical protein